MTSLIELGSQLTVEDRFFPAGYSAIYFAREWNGGNFSSDFTTTAVACKLVQRDCGFAHWPERMQASIGANIAAIEIPRATTRGRDSGVCARTARLCGGHTSPDPRARKFSNTQVGVYATG